jgi:hypothetical protein
MVSVLNSWAGAGLPRKSDADAWLARWRSRVSSRVRIIGSPLSRCLTFATDRDSILNNSFE